jgi:hypothetical protein
MGDRRERKFRRFNCDYPVHVGFPSENGKAEVDGVIVNISLGGLFLQSPSLIPHRSQVEFSITLQGRTISRPFKLTAAGEVVRVEPGRMTDGFGIAIACSQPIAQAFNL